MRATQYKIRQQSFWKKKIWKGRNMTMSCMNGQRSYWNIKSSDPASHYRNDGNQVETILKQKWTEGWYSRKCAKLVYTVVPTRISSNTHLNDVLLWYLWNIQCQINEDECSFLFKLGDLSCSLSQHFRIYNANSYFSVSIKKV